MGSPAACRLGPQSMLALQEPLRTVQLFIGLLVNVLIFIGTEKNASSGW